MGYDITIGNAYLEVYKEDLYMRIGAEHTTSPDAPVFKNDEMTGNGNCRSPSYIVWSDFCREVGLYGMFYGKDGKRNLAGYTEPEPNCHREAPILHSHPGAVLINEDDVEAVKNALDNYKIKHPKTVPGFDPWILKEDDVPVSQQSAHMARLEWLYFWVKWVVDNCGYC